MITTDSATVYYSSPLGMLEIKASDEVIHSILFANTWKGPKLSEAQMINEVYANTAVSQCITQLDEYFEGRRKTFDFAFSQDGTPFQLKVWNELLNIPFGKTISYLELSRRIGDAKAIRAVGTTNGKNQLCIIVPCHRVIGANGSLVGYGGELWRKKWLLDHESKYGNGVQQLSVW